MPEYTYHDEYGHVSTVAHAMLEDPVITCSVCGAVMSRLYAVPRINWAGFGNEKTPLQRWFKDGRAARMARNAEKYGKE